MVHVVLAKFCIELFQVLFLDSLANFRQKSYENTMVLRGWKKQNNIESYCYKHFLKEHAEVTRRGLTLSEAPELG